MVLTSHWYNDILLSAIVLFLLYKYIFRTFNYWEKRNVPYMKPYPFFGNLFEILTLQISIGEFLGKAYASFDGPFVGGFLLNRPILILRCPKIIRHVLVKDFHYFYDRAIASGEHEQIGNNMLFISKEPDWRSMRKHLTPVFSSGKLKAMYPIMANSAKDLNEYIMKNSGHLLDCKEICAKFTTDVIAKCAFAINAKCFIHEDADFRRIGKMIFGFSISNGIQQLCYFLAPDIVRLLKMKIMPQEALDFLNKVFWETVHTRQTKNIKRNDIIDVLIDLKNDKQYVEKYQFRGKKVVAQAVQFFVAGMETSSSSLSLTLYELSKHPEIQERLRKEIREALKTHNEITFESLMDMPYLHMCILETLRIYPVFPFLERKACADYKIPDSDLIVKKGTALFVPLMGLHHDPEYFPNPQEYNPERFAKEGPKTSVDFYYLPFGEGQRNCIGERFGMLTTKVGLAYVLNEYEVCMTTETPAELKIDPKCFTISSTVQMLLKFNKIN